MGSIMFLWHDVLCCCFWHNVYLARDVPVGLSLDKLLTTHPWQRQFTCKGA
jgi:hypothetical protein